MMILLIAGAAVVLLGAAGAVVGMVRDGYGWTRRRDCTPDRW